MKSTFTIRTQLFALVAAIALPMVGILVYTIYDAAQQRIAEAKSTARMLALAASADVDRVLTEAMEYDDGPCLIDAEVVREDDVFPMIPAGAALSDMIIEPPKVTLEKPSGST